MKDDDDMNEEQSARCIDRNRFGYCDTHDRPLLACVEAERAARIEPEVWRDGELWIAEIDHVAQGVTRAEAMEEFISSWREGMQLKRDEGYYDNDGAKIREAFDRRWHEELAASTRMDRTLRSSGIETSGLDTNQIDHKMCDVIESMKRERDALRAVVDPPYDTREKPMSVLMAGRLDEVRRILAGSMEKAST